MTPPNEPREPFPLLPVEWTAREYARTEDVVVRPSGRPGYVEIVRVPACVTRAVLKCPADGKP